MDSSEAPYRIEKQDGFFVLVFYPLLNDGKWANVAQVGTEILSRLEGFPDCKLIIDLSPLQYMGSAQVALLVRIWKSLKRLNGKMVLQVPGATVREILNIAGLHALWTIVTTRSAALAALNLPEPIPARQPPSFRQIPALSAAGVVAVLIAAGLAFWTTPAHQMILVVEWLVAAAALAAGVVSACRQSQRWRWISSASAVLALLILVSASLKLTSRSEVHEAAHQPQVLPRDIPFDFADAVAPRQLNPDVVAPDVVDPDKKVAGNSVLP